MYEGKSKRKLGKRHYYVDFEIARRKDNWLPRKFGGGKGENKRDFRKEKSMKVKIVKVTIEIVINILVTKGKEVEVIVQEVEDIKVEVEVIVQEVDIIKVEAEVEVEVEVIVQEVEVEAEVIEEEVIVDIIKEVIVKVLLEEEKKNIGIEVIMKWEKLLREFY